MKATSERKAGRRLGAAPSLGRFGLAEFIALVALLLALLAWFRPYWEPERHTAIPNNHETRQGEKR
jgi:hypothetical protein